MSAYTLGDVARICGVSRRRIRYWERTALIGVPPESGEQTAFGFRELLSVRSIVGLLERGVPLQSIRSNAEVVRQRFPDLEPLPALQTWNDTPRVVLHHDGRWMEPDGQLVLDFARDEESGEVESLVARISGADRSAEARACFERGCGLDGSPARWAEAAEAYRRAIELVPDFADAHCNLGSVRFHQGKRDEARRSFERAVEFEPRHIEAHLNLGTLAEEQGADTRALAHYRQALESDPLLPDTHISMALIYEKLELPRTARVHWKRYLQLEPAGSWARAARQRLDAVPGDAKR